MLGYLLYQHTGKVTRIRVLDTKKSKMETTVIANGKKMLGMSILLLFVGIFEIQMRHYMVKDKE